MTGEDQTIENLYKFTTEAERLANPQGTSNPINRFNSSNHPYQNNGIKPDGENFSNTEEGKNLAKTFGLPTGQEGEQK